MSSFSITRRALMFTLTTACGALVGCRHAPPVPLHSRVRDPSHEFGVATVPTVILPTLGEGPSHLRVDFQRALSAKLHYSDCMEILDSECPPVSTPDCLSRSLVTWPDQLNMLANGPAAQAVLSQVTYFQPTSPIKLGIVVELRDVATRATLRHVEWLWDASLCPPHTACPCPVKRFGEPVLTSNLNNISPKHLLEQAAQEISLDLESYGMTTFGGPNCASDPEPAKS